jgi:GT2 family glycosyltransferase
MNGSSFLSIIITAYSVDRAKDVIELLQSTSAQTYPNLETILVLTRSNELLEYVNARGHEAALESVRILFDDRRLGLSEARNLGVKQAKGDFLAFVDDDTILYPDWAEQLVNTYALDNSIIGVTGPATPLWADKSMSWLPEEFDWLVSCTSWYGENGLAEVRNAWGMNMSFRREAFEISGLFAPTTGGEFKSEVSPRPSVSGLAEDNEFSMRVRIKTGKRIVFNPRVRVWHKVGKDRLRWRYVIRRSYHIGQINHIMKALYSQYPASGNMLSAEKNLLRRILTRSYVNMLRSIPRNRLMVLRQMLLTIVVLLTVGLAYAFSSIPHEALALMNTGNSSRPDNQWLVKGGKRIED